MDSPQLRLISWLSNPLSAFIILANLFLMAGIAFNRQLRRAPHWFFLSLLFADLLAGAALPWLPLLAFERRRGYHGCFFIHVTPNFLFLFLLTNLLVVHYAKYLCIVRPLLYRRSCLHRWAAPSLLLAWAAPLLFACVPLAWNHWDPRANCSFHHVFPVPYLYLEIYGLLIPAILAMSFMGIRVLCVARRQLRNITRLLRSVQPGQAPSALEQQLALRHAKGIATLSFIVLVCWVPYVACLQVSLLAAHWYPVGWRTLTIFICLGSGSAALVPIILALTDRQYTQYWRDLATRGCCRALCHKPGDISPEAKTSGRMDPHPKVGAYTDTPTTEIPAARSGFAGNLAAEGLTQAQGLTPIPSPMGAETVII